MQSEIMYYMPSEKEIIDVCNVFDALADGTRVRMLSALSVSEMCVSDISDLLKINQSTVSHQLKYLKDLGLVRARRSGKIVLYSIGSECFYQMMEAGVNQIAK